MTGAGASTVVALGLDLGSTTCKLVGVDAGGQLAWSHLEPTEPLMAAQARRLLELAHAHGAAAGAPVVATGYGRKLVEGADRVVTEITCHARGVYRATGHGGTLVDIGGQDSKVIVIGAGGKVDNFAMNDKCAAGTGRFLEVTAGRLRMDLPAFSQVALEAHGEVPISSTCTVFAESEMISLLARGEPLPDIVAGLHHALVMRIAALARGVGLVPPVMLSGGVALSGAVRRYLEAELGQPVEVAPHPQLMGAYGAALLAGARAGGGR